MNVIRKTIPWTSRSLRICHYALLAHRLRQPKKKKIGSLSVSVEKVGTINYLTKSHHACRPPWLAVRVLYVFPSVCILLLNDFRRRHLYPGRVLCCPPRYHSRNTCHLHLLHPRLMNSRVVSCCIFRSCLRTHAPTSAILGRYP